jgi:hypothetical protein
MRPLPIAVKTNTGLKNLLELVQSPADRGLNKGEILAKPYSRIRHGLLYLFIRLITRVGLCPLGFNLDGINLLINSKIKIYYLLSKFLE